MLCGNRLACIQVCFEAWGQRGGRKSSLETISVFQMRDNSGLDWDCGSGVLWIKLCPLKEDTLRS